MHERISNLPFRENLHFQGAPNKAQKTSFCQETDASISLWLKRFKFTYNYLNHNLKAFSLTHRVKGLDTSAKLLIGALSLLLVDVPSLLAVNIPSLRYLEKNESQSNKEICANILDHSKHLVSHLFSSSALKNVWVIVKKALQLNITYDEFQKKELFNHKIREVKLDQILHTKDQEVALGVIQQAIAECQGFNFVAIDHYFKKQGIHLDQTKQAPTTKEEWEVCLLEADFSEQLAKQWTNHQQTIQALIWQVLQQISSSKNSMEKELLLINGLEHVLKMTFALLALPGAFTLKRLHTNLTQYPLAAVVALTYPLYASSSLSFKVSYFLLKIVKHFLMQFYKPGEYSFEGYKLSMQINYLEGMTWIYFWKPSQSQEYQLDADDRKEQLHLLQNKDVQQHVDLSNDHLEEITQALSQIHHTELFLQLCKDAFNIELKGEDPRQFKMQFLKYLRKDKDQK